MQENCVFCQIVKDHDRALVVYEDEVSLGFLDIRPLFPGHVLLIPKAHHATFIDLPADLLTPLFSAGQKIAQALEKVLAAEGSFVAMNNKVSQSVPHSHIHIVPRRRKDGLKGFFWPRNPYQSEEAMREVQKLLVGELGLGGR